MRLISNGNDCTSNVSFDESKKATCALPHLVPTHFLNPLTLKPLGHHFSLSKTFPILAPLSIPI
jgi:hypothetical protein